MSSAANATATLTRVDAAIQTVADTVSGIGDSQKRLSFKQENLSISMTNYEAARSRIADADFAKEQMEIVKLQILQQTGTATLAQATTQHTPYQTCHTNSALITELGENPESSLFGRPDFSSK